MHYGKATGNPTLSHVAAAYAALQPAVLGSKQRSSRKPQKTRQSSRTNLLQHIIKGQGSALTYSGNALKDFEAALENIRMSGYGTVKESTA